MRGKLLRDGNDVAEGKVVFHESIPRAGQFIVSRGTLPRTGDYTLTLDDRRTREVNVTGINQSTAHDEIASFTSCRSGVP
jgi:hypothetical protein